MNDHYNELLKDVLHFLRTDYVASDSVLASEDTFAFFAQDLLKKPSQMPGQVPMQLPAQSSLNFKQLPPPTKKLSPPPIEEKKSPPAPPKPLPQPKIPDASHPVADVSYKEIRSKIQLVLPHLNVKEDILNDQEAQNMRPIRTADVAICFEESGNERVFLGNLKRAIDTSLRPAVLIDVRNLPLHMHQFKWLLLSASVSLDKIPALEKVHEKTPEKIIFLSPATAYAENSALKQALWKTLCQAMKR